MAEDTESDCYTKVACLNCGQIFKTEKAESRHYTLEHNKELLVYTCEECKKNYTSPSSLKCHQASRHQGLVTKLQLNVRVRVGSKRSAESLPTQAKKAKITDPSKVKFRTITRSMATTSTEITPKLLLPTPEQPVYQPISPPRPSTSEDDQPAVIHQMPA